MARLMLAMVFLLGSLLVAAGHQEESVSGSGERGSGLVGDINNCPLKLKILPHSSPGTQTDLVLLLQLSWQWNRSMRGKTSWQATVST